MVWMIWGMGLVASAHPLGRAEFSLRTGLQITDEGLHAILVGEIPLAVVVSDLGRIAGGGRPTEAQVSSYTEARYAELAGSLSLELGGEIVPVEWTPVANSLNGRAADGFFVYMVEARLPAERLGDHPTIHTSTTAWPEAPMVYFTQTRVRSGGWTQGETTASRDWTTDARHRSLTATFHRSGAQPAPP